MKLSSLLTQRQTLLQQAQLANLAFAYERLGDFTRRIARAQLSGEVRLQQAAPESERPWASLTALQGSQSVIEEHFTDEDVMDLADLVAYSSGENYLDLTFCLEDLGVRFVNPLRRRLHQAGVAFDSGESAVDRPAPTSSEDLAHLDEGS